MVFGVCGFLTFYLVTRVYLPSAFAHADRRARDLEGYRRIRKEAAVEELKRADVDASQLAGDRPTENRELEAAVGRASAIAEKRAPQILWVDDNPENTSASEMR